MDNFEEPQANVEELLNQWLLLYIMNNQQKSVKHERKLKKNQQNTLEVNSKKNGPVVYSFSINYLCKSTFSGFDAGNDRPFLKAQLDHVKDSQEILLCGHKVLCKDNEESLIRNV